MSSFPGSPRVVKGGIALLDPDTGAVLKIIPLQYNSDTLTRTLAPKAVKEGADRSETLRLMGPAVETIKLDAEIDATDQLERADSQVIQIGIHAQLAALEMLVYPSSDQLTSNNDLARNGVLEIVPMETPQTLFIWSKNRIIPVRLTDFSITEEAFDPALNPIRAKVSLSMRVLSVDDLTFERGGRLFMGYMRQKEQFARQMRAEALCSLGLNSLGLS
jgi:hypothetical protein